MSPMRRTQEEYLDELLAYFVREAPEALWEIEGDVTKLPLQEKRRLLRACMNVRPAGDLPEEIEQLQDAYLSIRREERGVVPIEGIPTLADRYAPEELSYQIAPVADRLSLWQGDITLLATDAIVNAANSQMLGCFVPLHACIDNCIHTYAGVQLRRECHRKMQMLRRRYGSAYEQPTGVPMITGGYNLPAGHVVHVVGPIVTGPLAEAHRASLAACYAETLDLCAGEGLRTVAFCCISTGVFRFPGEEAAPLALRTVTEWLTAHPHQMDRVIFNVFSDRDRVLYQKNMVEGERGKDHVSAS